MDSIYIIKTLFIGCLGAGGFYFIISFVLHYFPLPILTKAKSILTGWTTSRHKEEGDSAHKIFKVGNFLLNFMMFLVWWAIFGLYAFLLFQMLHHYIHVQGSLFWVYYGMAILVPSLWVLYTCYRFYYPKEKAVEAPLPDDSDKTLLERMVGE